MIGENPEKRAIWIAIGLCQYVLAITVIKLFLEKNREGGGGDDVKVRFLSEKGGMKVEEEKYTYHIVQRMKTLQQWL